MNVRTENLQGKIVDITQMMRDVVLQGAREKGCQQLHIHYADNYWSVDVFANGRTAYANYAEEARGPSGNINDLSLWELAHLVESLRAK